MMLFLSHWQKTKYRENTGIIKKNIHNNKLQTHKETIKEITSAGLVKQLWKMNYSSIYVVSTAQNNWIQFYSVYRNTEKLQAQKKNRNKVR
jgi:hypothetical protein